MSDPITPDDDSDVEMDPAPAPASVSGASSSSSGASSSASGASSSSSGASSSASDAAAFLTEYAKIFTPSADAGADDTSADAAAGEAKQDADMYNPQPTPYDQLSRLQQARLKQISENQRQLRRIDAATADAEAAAADAAYTIFHHVEDVCLVVARYVIMEGEVPVKRNKVKLKDLKYAQEAAAGLERRRNTKPQVQWIWTNEAKSKLADLLLNEDPDRVMTACETLCDKNSEWMTYVKENIPEKAKPPTFKAQELKDAYDEYTLYVNRPKDYLKLTGPSRRRELRDMGYWRIPLEGGVVPPFEMLEDKTSDVLDDSYIWNDYYALSAESPNEMVCRLYLPKEIADELSSLEKPLKDGPRSYIDLLHAVQHTSAFTSRNEAQIAEWKEAADKALAAEEAAEEAAQSNEGSTTAVEEATEAGNGGHAHAGGGGSSGSGTGDEGDDEDGILYRLRRLAEVRMARYHKRTADGSDAKHVEANHEQLTRAEALRLFAGETKTMSDVESVEARLYKSMRPVMACKHCNRMACTGVPRRMTDGKRYRGAPECTTRCPVCHTMHFPSVGGAVRTCENGHKSCSSCGLVGGAVKELLHGGISHGALVCIRCNAKVVAAPQNFSELASDKDGKRSWMSIDISNNAALKQDARQDQRDAKLQRAKIRAGFRDRASFAKTKEIFADILHNMNSDMMGELNKLFDLQTKYRSFANVGRDLSYEFRVRFKPLGRNYDKSTMSYTSEPNIRKRAVETAIQVLYDFLSKIELKYWDKSVYDYTGGFKTLFEAYHERKGTYKARSITEVMEFCIVRSGIYDFHTTNFLYTGRPIYDWQRTSNLRPFGLKDFWANHPNEFDEWVARKGTSQVCSELLRRAKVPAPQYQLRPLSFDCELVVVPEQSQEEIDTLCRTYDRPDKLLKQLGAELNVLWRRGTPDLLQAFADEHATVNIMEDGSLSRNPLWKMFLNRSIARGRYPDNVRATIREKEQRAFETSMRAFLQDPSRENDYGSRLFRFNPNVPSSVGFSTYATFIAYGTRNGRQCVDFYSFFIPSLHRTLARLMTFLESHEDDLRLAPLPTDDAVETHLKTRFADEDRRFAAVSFYYRRSYDAYLRYYAQSGKRDFVHEIVDGWMHAWEHDNMYKLYRETLSTGFLSCENIHVNGEVATYVRPPRRPPGSASPPASASSGASAAETKSASGKTNLKRGAPASSDTRDGKRQKVERRGTKRKMGASGASGASAKKKSSASAIDQLRALEIIDVPRVVF